MKAKGADGLFWSKNYIVWLVYGLSALALMLLQTAPRVFPTVLNARPVPLVIFVACVALFSGARVGMCMGVLTGLLWDVYAFRLFGFDALVLMIIGLIAGLLVEWLLRANFFTAMLLCGGAVLFHSLAEWLFCHVLFWHDQLIDLLYKVYLPNAVYTLLLAPAMYGLTLLLARFIRRRVNG